MKKHSWLLLIILLAYTALGALYAAYTPPWQVPDEPAHYNYVRALATTGRLPVMETGDYDQEYIWQLVESRFDPRLSIAPITYEDHQPPLYYLLAAPLYILGDGALLPLRLLSVAIGTLLLLAAYRAMHTLFPNRPAIPLTGTALIAFLPQHLAMTSGVENDGLAELWIAVTLWLLLRHLQGRTDRRHLTALGLVLGLALLTKTTAYLTLPLTLLALWLRARRERTGRFPWRTLLTRAALVLGLALLIAAPWLGRNIAVYGWRDPLGLARHNSVVVGQPRTTEWLALYGWTGLLTRLLRTTFQSFFAQFGWMTVPLHPPFYLVLALVTATLAAGFAARLWQRRRALSPARRDELALLATTVALTVTVYLAYNLTFVQHQGRYLFPALVPLALASSLGLDWLLTPPAAGRAAIGLLGLDGLLLLWGLLRGDLPMTLLLGSSGLAALLGLAALWPRRGRVLATTLLLAALAALALYGLFGALLPTLS